MSDCYGPCQRGEACGQCGYQGPVSPEARIRKGFHAMAGGYGRKLSEAQALKGRITALRRALRKADEYLRDLTPMLCAMPERDGHLCGQEAGDCGVCTLRCELGLVLDEDTKAARRKR